MIEEWRAIPGWPEYSVSNKGQVRRESAAFGTRKGYVLKPMAMANGYTKVALSRGGRRREYTVHRLVASAFIDDPTGMDVCHNDGDRTNNAVGNLRIDTRKGNMADQVRHGTRLRGESVKSNKHPEETMRALLTRIRAGERVCDLSAETLIPRRTLYALAKRRIWGHLDN